MRSEFKLRRSVLLRTGAAALLVAGLGAGTASAASKILLAETGSSLLYPLFNIWVPHFEKAHPDIRVTTASTGSGTGIAQAMAGLVQIGASDAYMSGGQLKQHPDILNIPLAISAQAVNYNLPGLNDKNIVLSGPVLSAIYMGKITNWDSPEIAKLNPGVKLPNHKIVPVHRTDGSGDTFIFTQFLTKSTPVWKSKLGYGTTVSWPAVQGGLGAQGNPGMVEAIKGTKYSVAYIGVSYANEVAAAHLGVAKLVNKAGKPVLATAKTVTAAAAALSDKTPADERISLIFAPGDESYPIINYEYAIVSKKQHNAATAKAVRTLLTWASNEGNNPKYLDQVHFKALPPAIRKLSAKQIAEIKG